MGSPVINTKPVTLPSVLCVGSLLLIIGIVSASRDYLGFGTEVDFIGGFAKESIRLMRGEALLLEFHPPFYSTAIALVQAVVHDWFVTGRLVSFVAAFVVVIASYGFFSRVLSESAALGSLIVLAASPAFVAYSALASSDTFFMALYTLCLFLAFRASKEQSTSLWFVTGLVVGFAILSRTNAISLLVVLFVPWMEFDRPVRRRFTANISIIAGIVTPLCVWSAYAISTGSPFLPTGTYVNLALTYFPPDETMIHTARVEYAQQRFDGMWDVLTHDPLFLVQTYVKRLYMLPMHLTSVNGLLAYPANLLALPALLYLLYSARDRWVMYAIVFALLQVAVCTMKSFEARFYLFLIPLIGASIGQFVGHLFFRQSDQAGTTYSRGAVRLVVLGIAMVAVLNSVRESHERLTASDAELGEVIEIAGEIVPENSIVVARKPNIAFYTDSQPVGMVTGKSLEDLRQHIVAHDDGREIFVYYGSLESIERPEYADLIQLSTEIPWMKLEAKSRRSEEWALHRYIRPEVTD